MSSLPDSPGTITKRRLGYPGCDKEDRTEALKLCITRAKILNLPATDAAVSAFATPRNYASAHATILTQMLLSNVAPYVLYP